MPYKINWYIPQRVIHAEYIGDVVNADIEAISREVIPMLEAGITPLYFIANIEQSERISANPIKNRQDFAFVSDPRLEFVISCGYLHPIASFFMTIIRQTVSYQHKHFATFDEAIAFLKKHDPSLEPSKDTPHAISG